MANIFRFVLIIFSISFLFPFYGYAVDTDFPFSWIQDSIKITLHGIFMSDKNTIEGYVSENDHQYKLLIEYENTLNIDYKYKSSGFEKPGPGVGFIKFETDKGNLYGPKYVGGARVFSHLQPKYRYKTHNFAFNIPKNETPIKLIKYADQNYITEIACIRIINLISPPVPETTRIIHLGEDLAIENFQITEIGFSNPQNVIRGPFIGNKYAVFKPQNGYKFIIFKLKVTNISNEKASFPLYAGTGEFKLKVSNGYQS